MTTKPTTVSQEQVPVHLRGTRNAFSQWLGRTVLEILGWRVEGTIPDLKRLIVIGAPHTSNWDFPLVIAMAFHMRLNVYFIGKHTLIKGPAGPIMRWLGGIPLNSEAE